MSLKPYAEYKDSGVEWLGQVPYEWEVSRLKNSVQEAKNGVWGSDPDGSELDLRCVRVADFDRSRQSIHDRNSTLRRVSLDDRKGRILEKGDLLLEKSGGGEKSPVGFVVLYDREEPAVCSNFVARIVIRPGMDSRFWTYVHSMFYSLRLTQRSIKQATGIQNLDQTSYFNELVALPPYTVQCDIADYLDQETAEIDAFIADQEELIALLAERRTATITQAVTKGLDPNTPMRDSGVEWLGTVPQHWSPLKISRLTPVQESGVSVNGYREPASEGETGVLKTGASSKGYFDPNENKKVADEDLTRVACPLREGWLLINRANTPDLVGSAAFVTNAPRGLYLSDKLWQIDFTDADNKFIYWWMNSTVYKTQLQFHRVGASTSMQNLSYSDFKTLDAAVPPSDEQQEIATYLDRETAEIDAAIDDAREAIALSKERRAAVISAAVTGKIDVRGLVAQEINDVEGVSVGVA